MAEQEPIHIPRTRSGGTFSDSKDVKLHANDFDWDVKVAELTAIQRSQMDEYRQMCLSALLHPETASVIKDVPPKPWEAHFSSSKHHFPLKNYITHAFPRLRDIVARSDPPPLVLECGCGTGSTLLPIMRECRNLTAHFVGFDISPSALAHFRNHEVSRSYLEREKLTLFQLAIGSQRQNAEESETEQAAKRQRMESSEDLVVDALRTTNASLQDAKFDVVFLIFVLSALPTVEKMLLALKQLRRIMKPGGVLFFRDYALPDHNFYRFLARMDERVGEVAFSKGDSTTQVFFHKDFALKLFEVAEFVEVDDPASRVTYHCNRIENRKNGKCMDKIFINGTFKLRGDAPLQE